MRREPGSWTAVRRSEPGWPVPGGRDCALSPAGPQAPWRPAGGSERPRQRWPQRREAGEAGQRPGAGSGGAERRHGALHELTRLCAQRRGCEPGAAPAGPGAGGEGEPRQAAELWTGLKKGPPRKLKLPEPHVVLEELKKALS